MELAIISGKGGTGKSSISAAFATIEDKVILADCDVDAANLYLLFNPVNEKEKVYIAGHKAVVDVSVCTGCGLCESYCRFGAIKINDGSVTISEVSCDGCFLCSHICPVKAIRMVRNDKSRMYSGSFRNGIMVYGRLAPGEENSGKLVNMVREEAKNASKANGIEIIILDGPPGIGCPVISTVTGADAIVIVTEPTLSGLSDLERVHPIAAKFSSSVGVIINKHDLNSHMASRIEEWCSSHGTPVIGRLPFDSSVTEAMVAGKSVIELYPGIEISKDLIEMWNKIKQL